MPNLESTQIFSLVMHAILVFLPRNRNLARSPYAYFLHKRYYVKYKNIPSILYEVQKVNNTAADHPGMQDKVSTASKRVDNASLAKFLQSDKKKHNWTCMR